MAPWVARTSNETSPDPVLVDWHFSKPLLPLSFCLKYGKRFRVGEAVVSVQFRMFTTILWNSANQQLWQVIHKGPEHCLSEDSRPNWRFCCHRSVSAHHFCAYHRFTQSFAGCSEISTIVPQSSLIRDRPHRWLTFQSFIHTVPINCSAVHCSSAPITSLLNPRRRIDCITSNKSPVKGVLKLESQVDWPNQHLWKHLRHKQIVLCGSRYQEVSPSFIFP